MKQIKFWLTELSKSDVTHTLGLIWAFAYILMLFGVGNVSNANMEKAFSITMLVMGFFFTKNVKKKNPTIE